MEDKTKHIIAHAVYTICKILARELRLALKPLGIGTIILIIFLTIAEWSDGNYSAPPQHKIVNGTR